MLIKLPIEKIVEEYLSGTSQAQLAIKFGVDRRTIRRRLVKANVPIRTDGEASKLRKNKDFVETPLINQIIDGLMLGDAWIEQGSQQDNARLGVEVVKSSLPWLLQISEVLNDNVNHSITYRKPRVKTINGVDTISKETACLRTGLYGNFARQKSRWYPNGTKVIPKDLKLTPVSLAHWYWGDGCTSKYQMTIYTNNFSIEGCHKLIDYILNDFNIKFKISFVRDQPVLNLFNNSEREMFVNIIKDHVPSCFDYKIKQSTIIRRSKIWR